MILYPQVSPFRKVLNFLAANGFSIRRKLPPPIVGHQGDHSTKSAVRWRARRKITIGRVPSQP